MNRLIAVGVLGIGLIGGLLIEPHAVKAQRTSFPYGIGDTVTIEYPDNSSRTCLIEEFYELFVSCKPPARTATGERIEAKPWVYNLNTAVSVGLVKKAE